LGKNLEADYFHYFMTDSPTKQSENSENSEIPDSSKICENSENSSVVPITLISLWQSAKDHITTWWLHDLRPHDFHDFTTCDRSRNQIYSAKMSF